MSAARPSAHKTADHVGTSAPVFATISTEASTANTVQCAFAGRLFENVRNAAPPSVSQIQGSTTNSASP
jgi:hypothetical protein